MKNLAIMMAIGAGLLTVKTADAQIGLRVNLNFGQVAARVLVPAPQPQYDDYDNAGYDNSDDYYYLPDVEAYYNVPEHCYYYNDGQRWISAAYLPGRYHDFDWRSARHYEVHAQRPFMHHDMYRNRFGGFGQGFDNRYANRGNFDHRGDDNRGWGGNNRQGFDGRDRNDDRGGYGDRRGGFDNRGRDQRDNQPNYPQNGYNQPRGGNDNQGRGNYGQPQPGGNGSQYQNGGQQGQGRGNYGQQGGQYNGGQPVNQPGNGGQQGQGRGNHGGGQQGQPNNGGQQQGQPSNQNGGQDRGNRGGGDEHFAANKMGMTRPGRF